MAKENDSHADDWPPEVLEQVNRDRAVRKLVRQRYNEIFDKVTEAMFRHDPIGINSESNLDEYDLEAGTVIPRLKECSCQDDVARVIHEEFTKWFDVGIAGSRTRYSDLAAEIWNLWTNSQISRSS